MFIYSLWCYVIVCCLCVCLHTMNVIVFSRSHFFLPFIMALVCRCRDAKPSTFFPFIFLLHACYSSFPSSTLSVFVSLLQQACNYFSTVCLCTMCVYIILQTNAKQRTPVSTNIRKSHSNTHTHTPTYLLKFSHARSQKTKSWKKLQAEKKGRSERERVREKEAALPSHFFRAVFFGAFSFIFHHVAEDGMYSIQFMILKTYTHISSV